MEIAQEYSYVGGELELFMKAVNWKNYWSSRVRPFVHGKVLDVGAGVGSHALVLQQRGLDVTAMDISASAVTIMKQRGLKMADRPKRRHMLDFFASRSVGRAAHWASG